MRKARLSLRTMTKLSLGRTILGSSILSASLVVGVTLVPLEAGASHEEVGQKIISIDSSVGSNDQQFSLVLDDDGRIFGAGSNNRGQLGTGDTFTTATPRAVVSTGVLADKTIVAIATGTFHSLALDADGGIYAWGENESGQLGDGTTTDRNAPMAVDLSSIPSGRKIVEIAAGSGHSAAIDDEGVVYTWGDNSNGQLGDGTTTTRLTPTSLSTAGALSGLKIVGISLGGRYDSDEGYLGFSVAVSDSGSLVSWGTNNDGELGDGSTSQRTSPVLVDDSGAINGKTIASVSSSERFSIALDSDGLAYGWGANNYGQIGDGSTTRKLSPTAVDASGVLAGITLTQVAAGGEFTLAVDDAGALFAWGLNGSGQLGDGTFTNRSNPVLVDASGALSGKEFVAVAAGYRSALVLDDAGSTFAWGSDAYGQLGVGLGTAIRSPIEITPAGALQGKTIQKTGFGYNHTLFLDSAGVVFAAGQNSYGKLGDGTSTTATAPITSGLSGGVLEGKTFTSVVTGVHHSLALDNTGKVYSWGLNNYGQLGIGSTENAGPTLVGGLIATKTIVAIAAGGYHSLALDSDGVLYSWGYNVLGSLGVGDNTNRSLPAVVDASGVLSGKTISSIHAGDHHTVVLDTAGNAYSWGANSNGQLGDNTTDARNAPVAVYTAGDLSGKTITQLSSGMYHTIALDSDGSVYTWGYNGDAEIGDGSGSANQVSPKLINLGAITGKTITEVAAGWGYSLVLDDQGVAYSWGRNGDGQLGLLNPSNATTPTAVDASGVLAGKTLTGLSAGFSGSASFATGSDGSLYGWGRNLYSDLSIGDTSKYWSARVSLFEGHVAAVSPVSSPAPAQSTTPAPYMGPLPISYALSSLKAGESQTVSGLRLAGVESVSIDGVLAEITSRSSSSISFVIPAGLAAGLKNLIIVSPLGTITAQGAFSVEEPAPVAKASKVNAGSFKGYVALYALGHEGKRLSAKVGNDWVIIPEIPAATNDLFRFVEFTGAGYEIRVRIYIDRELLRTVDLTTR